jgi:nicotinamidase-related amidase
MENEAQLSLSPDDALIVVDVQNDFLPGGALGVPGGDEVVPVLNDYLRRFAENALPIFATRDWHPPDHCSFVAAGGPWPSHCVAGSFGAQFPASLALPSDARIISKATGREPDAYSGFAGTDLGQQLRSAGIQRLFVGGLATDYCVLNTVKDALAGGFLVVLLLDAIRAVGVRPDDESAAIAEMSRLGAQMARLESIV